jgi:A/G-specific adenine glycosylase
MAQQTRVEVVVPYFERFIARFPDVQALVAAPVDDVLALWSGLGYYRRARLLHEAAQAIVRDFGGELPANSAALRRLPGVGPYTAAAIASIAFDEPALALDGNVARVLARLFLVRADVTRPSTTKRLRRLGEVLLPHETPGRFNEALMELGALICTPASPACLRCPVRRWCRAFERGMVDSIPVRAKPAAPREVRLLAAAVIDHAGRLLLIQNPPRGLFGGLWLLPQIERGAGKTDKRRLSAFVRQAAGVTCRVGESLGVIEHTLSHRRLVVEVVRCDCAHSAGRQGRWVDLRGPLPHLALPAYTAKAMRLVAGLRRGAD